MLLSITQYADFKVFCSKTTSTNIKTLMTPLCSLSMDRGLCPYKPRDCHHRGLSMLSWGAASPKPMSVWCRSSQIAPCAVYITYALSNKQLSDSTQFPRISFSVLHDLKYCNIPSCPILPPTSTTRRDRIRQHHRQ